MRNRSTLEEKQNRGRHFDGPFHLLFNEAAGGGKTATIGSKAATGGSKAVAVGSKAVAVGSKAVANEIAVDSKAAIINESAVVRKAERHLAS